MRRAEKVGRVTWPHGRMRKGARSAALVIASLAVLGIAAGCSPNGGASSGASAPETGAPVQSVEFSQVAETLENTCSKCHDSGGIGEKLSDIQALPDSTFTEAAFPDSAYPAGLTKLGVQALIDSGDPVEDKSFTPGMSQRKAWTLHELHELKALLAEDVPPDFTSQASFDSFARLGEPGHYEGCEVLEKLDLGHENDPEGMPPKWGGSLDQLLKIGIAPVSQQQRADLKAYTAGLLPGGADACK